MLIITTTKGQVKPSRKCRSLRTDSSPLVPSICKAFFNYIFDGSFTTSFVLLVSILQVQRAISAHAVLVSVIDGHIPGYGQSAIQLYVISPVCFVLCPLICSTFTWLFQMPMCPSTCMSTICGSVSLSVILCWYHVDFRYLCELRVGQ
jgi:hypothetical protein